MKKRKKKNTLQHTVFTLVLTLIVGLLFWSGKDQVAAKPPEEGSRPSFIPI